jgi:hypothetical protein
VEFVLCKLTLGWELPPVLRYHFTSDPYLYLTHLRPALYSKPWLVTALLNETLKMYGGMMATCTTEKLRGGKLKVGLREKSVRVEVSRNSVHRGPYN